MSGTRQSDWWQHCAQRGRGAGKLQQIVFDGRSSEEISVSGRAATQQVAPGGTLTTDSGSGLVSRAARPVQWRS